METVARFRGFLFLKEKNEGQCVSSGPSFFVCLTSARRRTQSLQNQDVDHSRLDRPISWWPPVGLLCCRQNEPCGREAEPHVTPLFILYSCKTNHSNSCYLFFLKTLKYSIFLSQILRVKSPASSISLPLRHFVAWAMGLVIEPWSRIWVQDRGRRPKTGQAGRPRGGGQVAGAERRGPRGGGKRGEGREKKRGGRRKGRPLSLTVAHRQEGMSGPNMGGITKHYIEHRAGR